jgi:hypothetical protein
MGRPFSGGLLVGMGGWMRGKRGDEVREEIVVLLR